MRLALEDFKALLSPAAEPYLEQMAQRAKLETSRHLGIQYICLHRFTLQITVKTIVSIADLTVITIFTV